MRDGASLFSLSLVCCLEKTFYRFLLDPQDISSCPKLDVDPGIWSHGSTTWANYLTFLWLIIFIYKMEIRITLWKLNELLYIKGLLTVVPSTCNFLLPVLFQWHFSWFIVYTLLFGSEYHCDWGFPGGACGKEPTCQCMRHEKCRFDHWVGKISWRKKQ